MAWLMPALSRQNNEINLRFENINVIYASHIAYNLETYTMINDTDIILRFPRVIKKESKNHWFSAKLYMLVSIKKKNSTMMRNK